MADEYGSVRVYAADQEALNELADRREMPVCDVVSDLLTDHELVEHRYVCPECNEPFHVEEVDMETVEEAGLMDADLLLVLRDRRTVRSFECPRCNERITPDDARKDARLTEKPDSGEPA